MLCPATLQGLSRVHPKQSAVGVTSRSRCFAGMASYMVLLLGEAEGYCQLGNADRSFLEET